MADRTRSILFKTKLCACFMSGKLCFEGKSCTFAHGYAELRSVSAHPRYRTRLCRYISLGMECPYGERCFFIHPQ
ncbi:unnamed protein product [Rodentolepis nana]|uniref:C3H1-type domain-containing protein n=1 Tax=Rodentolepis nana TaxID=102285 RepID=A0A0R3THJ6_RODNA|nr:unnamed protein product [Rodentolepis nana]